MGRVWHNIDQCSTIINESNKIREIRRYASCSGHNEMYIIFLIYDQQVNSRPRKVLHIHSQLSTRNSYDHLERISWAVMR